LTAPQSKAKPSSADAVESPGGSSAKSAQKPLRAESAPGAAPETEPPEHDLDDPQYFLNRELTWLAFNWRVLHEAEDPRTPLLERVKFLAIVASILISGVTAFFIQRAVRGAIRDRTTHLATLLAHGGWVGGGMLAGLTYFMLVKGMRHVGFVQTINDSVVHPYGPAITVLALWGAFAIAIHNIPEGIAIAVPVYFATQNKFYAFSASLLSGLAEPVGAALGYWLLSGSLSHATFGWVFGLIAGVMVFLALDELLPAAKRYAKGHETVYGLVAGMGTLAISLVLFKW